MFCQWHLLVLRSLVDSSSQLSNSSLSEGIGMKLFNNNECMEEISSTHLWPSLPQEMCFMASRQLLCQLLVLSCQAPLFSAIIRAWQATAKGRRGLFDRSFDAEAFRNSTDTVFNFGPLVDSISAHYLWLTYLDEVWKVRSSRC